MDSANEMRLYYATSPLIGWAHTQDDSCNIISATRIAIFQKSVLQSVEFSIISYTYECVDYM